MAKIEKQSQSVQAQLDAALKRALATPPISNEDIVKRSKESHSK